MGPRQRIIEKAGGKQLAVIVIDNPLADGLADALCGRAVKLTCKQGRVDNGADVVGWDDDDARIVKATGAGIPTADLRQLDWSRIAALVLAPGVPLTHPVPHWSVGLARAMAVPVIGDIELFCRERRRLAAAAPFVAITGTNGKSTTTALAAHLAASAGMDAQLGGNIGTAILSLEPPQVSDIMPTRVHVIECSSYQIDLAPSLDPSIGILINLSEDHLDRHGTMTHYADVKARLVTGVSEGGTAIVGVDDEWCRAVAAELEKSGKRVVRVSVQQSLADGVYVEEARILRAIGGKASLIAEIGGIGSLRGLHNAQNAACAAAAALALGLEPAGVQSGLRSFPGLAHRMEEVVEHGLLVDAARIIVEAVLQSVRAKSTQNHRQRQQYCSRCAPVHSSRIPSVRHCVNHVIHAQANTEVGKLRGVFRIVGVFPGIAHVFRNEQRHRMRPAQKR